MLDLEPTQALAWSLAPFALFGALSPLRREVRDDHGIVLAAVAVNVAIAGPRGFVPIALAAGVAVIVLFVRGRSASDDHQAARAARKLDVQRLLITMVALTAATAAVTAFYVAGLDDTFPMRLDTAGSAFAAFAAGVVGVVVSLGIRVVAYQRLGEGFHRRDPDTFESLLVPYLTTYVAGAAVVGWCLAMFQPEVWWLTTLAFAWTIPVHLLAQADIRQRRAAEVLRREALVQQRLVAIGEIAARVRHQSRHEVGLMGWSTHRLRALLHAEPPIDRGAIDHELDALGAATERLTASLAFELADDGAPRTAPTASGQSVGILVATVYESLGGKMRLKSVDVGIEMDDATAHRCPPDGIYDALFNLVDNALDAAATRVSIGAAIDDGRLVVRVTDDGPGLSLDAARALEPFVTTKPDGTGMGLAIADAIAADLGGRISYERAHDGTTFRLDIPMAADGPLVPVPHSLRDP